MSSFRPCPLCACHVKAHETLCPFCERPLKPSGGSPGRSGPRMSRATWLAIGSVATTGCVSTPSPSRAEQNALDATASDSAITDSMTSTMTTGDSALEGGGADAFGGPMAEGGENAPDAGDAGDFLDAARFPCGDASCTAGVEFCEAIQYEFFSCRPVPAACDAGVTCECAEPGCFCGGVMCNETCGGSTCGGYVSCSCSVDDAGVVSPSAYTVCYGAPPARLEGRPTRRARARFTTASGESIGKASHPAPNA
jgi:hypothetical protein